MSLAAVRLLAVVSVISVVLADARSPAETNLSMRSENFKYFSSEGDETAKILLNYKTNATLALKRYVKELKTSNAASKALIKYNDENDSLQDTKCVDEEDEDHFTGAQENIETIVDTCEATVPQDDFNKLNQVVMEALDKVQQADVELMMITKMCSQFKEDPPASCEDDKQKALNAIKGTVSSAGVARISHYVRNAFFNTKLAIDNCVEEGTEDLKETLDEWRKTLDECEKNLK